MKRFLMLDCSTAACSVALGDEGGVIVHEHHVAPREHAQRLLPAIESCLSEAGWSRQQLDGLVWGAGPGSFTGLRIAAGVVQGLAFALDKPAASFSSLRCWAQGIYRTHGLTSVLVLQNAQREQLYSGAYLVRDKIMQPTEDQLIALSALRLDSPVDGLVLGEGLSPDVIESQSSLASNRFLENTYPDAQDLWPFAQAHPEAFLSAEHCLPQYLQNPFTQ